MRGIVLEAMAHRVVRLVVGGMEGQEGVVGRVGVEEMQAVMVVVMEEAMEGGVGDVVGKSCQLRIGVQIRAR